jgi:hypothetical protein
MNCRDFLIEFEDRNALTEAATLHLSDCRGCQKTKAEQIRVWQMIDGLGRVDVPKNFDFRLKARIAKANAVDFKPRFVPMLRYVLPLSAIVLVFALVVFNTVFLNDKNIVPQVAENNFPASVEKENTLDKTLTGQSDSANNYQASNDEKPISVISSVEKQSKKSIFLRNETELVAVKPLKKVETGISQKTFKNDFKGSIDSSFRTSPEKLPKGLDSNQKVETAPNITGTKTITAAETLLQLGIETVLENGKRVVKAVRQKSVGEISEIKSGDIVEAIDGKKLNGEPIPGKKIEGKTLTITRGAEKMEIPLRNQPIKN